MTLWPALEFEAWRDTYATLHRYMQVIGKVQLALTPLVNHYWNVAFEVTERGLRTAVMPYNGRQFAVELDFIDHNVVIRTSDGAVRALALIPRPVASFYRDFMAVLSSLAIEVSIWPKPVEMQSEVIPFHSDWLHATYDEAQASRCWRVLAQSAPIFQEFRARFIGKCSPVHFFWGSFDLAVSRFSGRRAPPQPHADPITRESYSHEVSSVGFWPGDARYPHAAYYAYTVPAPAGLAAVPVRPAGAFWSQELGEFLLPYDVVREAGSPREVLLEFMQSTYEAGAELAGWDRAALERPTEAEAEAPEARPPTEPLH